MLKRNPANNYRPALEYRSTAMTEAGRHDPWRDVRWFPIGRGGPVAWTIGTVCALLVAVLFVANTSHERALQACDRRTEDDGIARFDFRSEWWPPRHICRYYDGRGRLVDEDEFRLP